MDRYERYEGDKFTAGDIIRQSDGRLDYLIAIPGETGLWTNACNPAWIERGLRLFGQECYPFTNDDAADATVVGHQGGGSREDAAAWYAAHRGEYAGLAA